MTVEKKEEEVKPEETKEAPAPEESKSVQDLIDEREKAEEASTETPPETPPEEPPKEEAPPEETLEEKPSEERQVPVKALQRERQKKQAAEARAKAAEARAAALEAQRPPEPKPVPENFDTQEQYDNAVREREIQEEVARQLKVKAEEESQREAKVKAEKEVDAFTSLMGKAHDADEKFEERFQYVDSVSRDNHGYSRALVTSPVADKVISHLANNPEEAERIATLSDVEAVKAIGAIEDKIKSPPKPNTTTRAPQPVAPVGGTAKTDVPKYNPDMSAADKAAARKKAEESGMSVAEYLGITGEL
jgi:hypothetical protein